MIGGEEYKISAYADDLLFFLTRPKISLPNLLKEIQRYGGLSSFHSNMQKSVSLNLSMTPETGTLLKGLFALKWEEKIIILRNRVY